ncbi:MAG: SdrD B-like domain-containing protein [Anaerolineales bacterium]
MKSHSWPLWLAALITMLLLSTSACDVIDGIDFGPRPTSTVSLPGQGTSAISGRLWHDECDQSIRASRNNPAPAGCVLDQHDDQELEWVANGEQDQKEAGIAGIQVTLGSGECPSIGLATAQTNTDGIFIFPRLAPGRYCVLIDPSQGANATLLLPGQWTAPTERFGSVVAGVTVTLMDQEIRSDIDFGWDYELLPDSSYIASSTEAPTETPTSTIAPVETLTEQSTAASPTLEFTPSPTPYVLTGPGAGLGQPDFVENFEDGRDWYLYADGHVTFNVTGDELLMTAINPDEWTGWLLTWPEVDDFYLEVEAEPGDCSGLDNFGLVARVGTDGGYYGYLAGVACNGQLSLRWWTGVDYVMLAGWRPHEVLTDWDGGPIRIGLWAEGDTLKFYINNQLVAEIEDDRQLSGLFGLYIGSYETPEFDVSVQRVLMWELPSNQ